MPPAPHPPGMPDYQAHKDAEHIKLLSIFHYVYAGLLAVGTLWPLIYVGLGLMMVSIPMTSPSSVGPPSSPVASSPMSPGSGPSVSSSPSAGAVPASPAVPSSSTSSGGVSHRSSSTTSGAFEAKFMGWMFFAIGVVMSVGFLVMALANFLAGRFMSSRRRRIFILVISGLNSMVFPFGTGLAVFTFIVLLRPSVEGLFEGRVEAVGGIK